MLPIKCQQEGVRPVPSISIQSPTAKQRASTGKQPSVSKMPPLISEFHCVQAVYSKQPPSLYATSWLTKVFQGVPASSRLIRANKEGSSDQTASSLAEDELQEYKFAERVDASV